MMEVINFSGLENTESLKRRNKYLSMKPVSAGQTRRFWFIFGLIILGGLLLLPVVLLLMIVLGPVVIVVLPVLAVWLMVYAKKRGDRINQAFAQFVQANKWLEGGKLPEDIKQLRTNIKQISDWVDVHGQLDCKPFWLHKTFDSTMERGATRAQITNLTIDLQSKVPTVLALSRSVQFAYNSKRELLNKMNLVPINLEGDFDQYLQLYAIPGQQIDALSYITPDVMQALIEDCWMVSVEYYDHYINLSCPYSGFTYTPIRQIFTAAQTLIRQHNEKHT